MCPTNAVVTLAGEKMQEKVSDKSHPNKYTVPGEYQLFWASVDLAVLVYVGCAGLRREAPH